MDTANYNPDVLSCIANLSSDEVFTPPELVNQMLDMLPESLWSNKKATFLDPACKSGVFLREIAKRLDIGLEAQIPDRQKRIDHIFTKQLFGLAITELTSLLSRRSLYCSKAANGKYSVCSQFKSESGNIHYTRIEHTWQNGRCIYCGASEQGYDRGEELESHAYSFIHTENPEDLFKMKFDVIIGNPPYQMSDAGDSTGSSPIYDIFVERAKKLNPRYLSMIIPSRWFAGGKGLNRFRDAMLNDNRVSHLVDYPIASDVFPGVKINGGVCFFLWERDYNGHCFVETHMNGEIDSMTRPLNEFETFVRFNKAITVLKKVLKDSFQPLSEQISTQKPFGLRTYVKPVDHGDISLYANKAVGRYNSSDISSGNDMIYLHKVLISRGYGEGGEAREYPRMIIGKPIIAYPPSACTETYIVVGAYDNEAQAHNLSTYLQTRFLRFLVSLKKNTQDVTRDRFTFVPIQDFSQPWTDAKLYKKYNLSQEEIDFIESMIRPMELADA